MTRILTPAGGINPQTELLESMAARLKDNIFHVELAVDFDNAASAKPGHVPIIMRYADGPFRGAQTQIVMFPKAEAKVEGGTDGRH